MKLLLVLASFGVLVSSAPQSSQYAAPSGPAAGYDASSIGNLDVAQLLSSLRSQLQNAPQSSYAQPLAARDTAQFSSSSYSAPQPEYNAPSTGSSGTNSGSGSGSGSGNSGYPGNAYGAPEEPQKVHKHVFVHEAPQEPITQKPFKAAKIPQKPEKHYKILFIKAPTPAPYEYPEVPDLPVLPEQKTLVYVLLKSAEPTQEITLPTYASTKPSKPEVYFIRYKNPEGADKEPNNEYGPPTTESSSSATPAGYSK